MARDWANGRRVGAEAILEDHPELRDDPDAVLDLVYEEISLSRRYGGPSTTAEIINRFPRWRTQLEVLLSCDRLLNPDAPVSARAGLPSFPSAGEKLADFTLLADLGSGSVGRVFLATQPALAYRPVVLKSPGTRRVALTTGCCAEGEYLSLARLQHTNIVPLYSVQHDPQRNLHILCMPWFGGATLAQILSLLAPIPRAERTGRHLVDALDQVQSALPPVEPGGERAGPRSATSPLRQFLARCSYVHAFCWITACLADALQYVHERGVIHLDLKPSNVLLADDGQPMLLDFHLARPPLAAGEPAPEWLGGTPAFMSPEQQLALAAVRLGRPLTQGVDGRSDVYSLGLLLAEALLGGPVPVGEHGPQPLPGNLPGVSPGLRDIVARSVCPDVEKRYPDAASLAADLRCHLNNLPLRGVPNRSWIERLQKWRRQPHRSALLAMAGIVLLAAVGVALIGVAHLNGQVVEARSTLAEGRKDLDRGRPAEALERFQHGQALLDYLPGCVELRQELLEQQRLAERLQAVEELHQVVERVRFLSGQDALPAEKARPLQERCGALWAARRRLLEPPQDDQEERKERIRLDLLDLAVLWGNLLVRSAREPNGRERSELRSATAHDLGPARAEVRRSALAVLDEAEELLGQHPVLSAERQDLANQLGLTGLARESARRLASLPLRTAWEHYALGRFHLGQGRVEEAARLFDRAVELQPDSFWAHFYRGQCAYRQGQPHESIASFTACLALTSERAVCYYNRALAHSSSGRDDKALLDYTQALALDPTLGPAWLNRGVLNYRARRYARARADMEQALKHQVRASSVRYNLALVARAEGNRAAARASAEEALKHDPNHQEAREFLRRLDLGR
jgi:serine/threonine protein kinase/tetratricopeptide (TPR) repeat protein